MAVDYEPAGSIRQPLLHSSLVCFKWRDVALEVMWRTSVVPAKSLFGLLQPHVNPVSTPVPWNIGPLLTCMRWKEPSGTNDMFFVTQESWVKFLRRASMITSLHLRWDSVDQWMSTKVESLLERANPICSRLTSVTIALDHGQVWGTTATAYRLLVPTSLSTISHFSPVPEEPVAELAHFPWITRHTPNVKQAHIEYRLPDLGWSGRPYFGGLPSVEHLQYRGPFILRSWLSLAGCLKLEQLLISSISATFDPHDRLEPMDEEPFVLPALWKLHLYDTHRALRRTLPIIFQRTRFPGLRELELNVEGLGEEQLADVFSQHPVGWENLAHFRLRTFQLDGLEVIHSFSRLRHLSVTTSRGVTGQSMDQWVERLARALPDLQVFVFALSRADTGGDLRITLKALLTLATHCRSLRELELVVHAESIRYQPAYHRDPAIHAPSLKSLTLSPLYIPENGLPVLARLLRSLFPTLESLSCDIYQAERLPGPVPPLSGEQVPIDRTGPLRYWSWRKVALERWLRGQVIRATNPPMF